MGTLVRDPFHSVMPAFFGMNFDEMLQSKDRFAWIDFELGLISEEEFLTKFFSDRRVFDFGAFSETVEHAYEFLPGAQETLVEMQKHGIEMHACSNYPNWYRRIERRIGLSRYLNWSFVSCEMGLRKPDLRFFFHAADHLRLPPQSCVFIDDRMQNCEAALRAGMDSLHLGAGGIPAIREDLASLGLIET